MTTYEVVGLKPGMMHPPILPTDPPDPVRRRAARHGVVKLAGPFTVRAEAERAMSAAVARGWSAVTLVTLEGT